MKRSKTLAVKSRVVRRIKEVQNDYRWWRYVDEAPDSGYVEDIREYVEPAYPELQKTTTQRGRRPTRLSRARLRERMARLGFRDSELTALVQCIAGRGPLSSSMGLTYAGWARQDAKQFFGRRVARELRRGVAAQAIYLDEMGYYMMPGFGKLVEGMRTWMKTHPSHATVQVESSYRDVEDNAAMASATTSSPHIEAQPELSLLALGRP